MLTIGVDTVPWRLSANKVHTRPEDIHLLVFVPRLGLCSLETLFHLVEHTIHRANLYCFGSNWKLFGLFWLVAVYKRIMSLGYRRRDERLYAKQKEKVVRGRIGELDGMMYPGTKERPTHSPALDLLKPSQDQIQAKDRPIRPCHEGKMERE